MKMRPDDWTYVVRRHVQDTKGFIVSSQDPTCIKMAQDEIVHIDRWMEHILIDGLPTEIPRSWFMAVIVCPGDDLSPFATWMDQHGSDRVRFYLHRDAEFQQLATIRDAGHDLAHVRPEKSTSYGQMHKRLGLDLSDQVYGDFTP